MNKKPLAIIGALVALGLFITMVLRGCGNRSAQTSPDGAFSPGGTAVNFGVSSASATVEAPAVSTASLPAAAAPVKKPALPKAAAKPVVPPVAQMAPPPVKIFKELIPKDIAIVRVYYANILAAPNSSIEFDINGSGFTQEFQKMIEVQSGQPEVTVQNLSLVTPNQIHGTLVVSAKSETRVAFPQVLIGGKTVFQAPEPFAVIRPNEVLNLIFTEMNENGRAGRFRVFTNLTPEMFPNFKVVVSTPAIEVYDLTPAFPFIVDGIINIGPAVSGSYDISVLLKDKPIWKRDGIIHVVKPNIGQSGLIQRVQPTDGFHRPGDRVEFLLQGSGFQPQDVSVLRAVVPGLELVSTTFTFIAPGRMELALQIPKTTPPGSYGLTLTSGDNEVQQLPHAFQVVGKNWARRFIVDPALAPGGKSTLKLVGRDFSPEFISQLKIELDEPNLSIGSFKFVDAQQADAPITAGPDVKPGDYLLHVTAKGAAVSPQFGSLIRISKN